MSSENFENLQSMLDKRPRVAHRPLIKALVKLGEPVTAEKYRLAAQMAGYRILEGAERSWDLTSDEGIDPGTIALEIENAFNEALESVLQDGR